MRNNLQSLDRQRRSQSYSPKPRRVRPQSAPETQLTGLPPAGDRLDVAPVGRRSRLSARQGMGLVTVLLNVACAGAAAATQEGLAPAWTPAWAPLPAPAPARGPRALLA